MRPGSGGTSSTRGSSALAANSPNPISGSSANPSGEDAPKKTAKKESIAYSPLAIANNHHILEYCRTSMAALSGAAAGILGLTSLQGFGFYLVMLVVLFLMIVSKAGSNADLYFTSKWALLTNNFIGGLTTYVLFWTFLYGMVHVY